MIASRQPQRRPVKRRAFSLIELLLAVSLMTLILYGLYTIFSQTQQALRMNVNQADVLGVSQGAVELLVSDLQRAGASGGYYGRPHFTTGMQTNSVAPFAAKPLVQELADGSQRINFLNELFFLKRDEAGWSAVGYFVSSSRHFAVDPLAPREISYGTLYRCRIQSSKRRVSAALLEEFHERYRKVRTSRQGHRLPGVSVQPLIDGVVHFRIVPVDSSGAAMTYWTNSPTAELANTNYQAAVLVRDLWKKPIAGETRSLFTGHALPAFCDLEIGILEPDALGRVRAMGSSQLADDYLRRQPGDVHLLRRMVPLNLAQKIRPIVP